MKKGGLGRMLDVGNISLNSKKLDRMKVSILEIEQQNLKTREKSNDAMVDAIRKIVIDEVNKSY
ncbi:MAG: hypothetical protein GX273_06045 [Bacteroidales bacterium]|nr:hypothetical protein [Bacteroidales bacterium]